MDANNVIILTCLGVGCNSSAGSNVQTCETRTAVDASDASLGFSAADINDLATSSTTPSRIDWDEISASEKSSAMTLVLDGYADEQVEIVDNPMCAGGTVLSVPLNVSITIADGDVVATGQLPVQASELTDVGSISLAPSREVPASVSGDYEAAIEEYFASDASEDRSVTGVGLVGVGPWTNARIDLEVSFESDDSTGAEVLWRGHWAF